MKPDKFNRCHILYVISREILRISMKFFISTLALICATISFSAFAQLNGDIRRNWIGHYYDSCYKSQKLDPANAAMPAAMLSQYCVCAGEQTAQALNNDLVADVESGKIKLPDGLIQEAGKYCLTGFRKFPNVPFAEKIITSDIAARIKLFNGTTQRFTAYRQFVYDKNWKLLEDRELPNGKYLFDVNIASNRAQNVARDVKTGILYTLFVSDNLNSQIKQKGFDFQFFVPEISGYLTINSVKNIFFSYYFELQDGRYYETHYVRSQALICTALNEAKLRIQKSMAVSLFKEILLVAIKSYAGTSYSGGTFSGTTTAGGSFLGTFQKYDNSWLGEHYSRGLDAVFNGTATLGQISEEQTRLSCSEL
jgi:hypothetical protein